MNNSIKINLKFYLKLNGIVRWVNIFYRLLPIANVERIMKRNLPINAKVSLESKLLM